ncbi:hypothetical protein BU17DRAFT_66215 [Hysterangium stoloniferum]|nr:hypothetical protein BU17DRAFT_66215 [Hysterangium stoloniferum]
MYNICNSHNSDMLSLNFHGDFLELSAHFDFIGGAFPRGRRISTTLFAGTSTFLLGICHDASLTNHTPRSERKAVRKGTSVRDAGGDPPDSEPDPEPDSLSDPSRSGTVLFESGLGLGWPLRIAKLKCKRKGLVGLGMPRLYEVVRGEGEKLDDACGFIKDVEERVSVVKEDPEERVRGSDVVMKGQDGWIGGYGQNEGWHAGSSGGYIADDCAWRDCLGEGGAPQR